MLELGELLFNTYLFLISFIGVFAISDYIKSNFFEEAVYCIDEVRISSEERDIPVPKVYTD